LDSHIGSHIFPAMPIQEILALLLVNKQIYRETMPIFYDIDIFVFPNFTDLLQFARRTAPERFRHITGIVVDIDPKDLEKLPSVGFEIANSADLRRGADMLSKLKPLSLLKVGIWDEEYLFHRIDGRLAKPQRFIGMRELAIAGSKAKSFKVDGDCEQLQDYLLAKSTALKLANLQARPESEHAEPREYQTLHREE
jgi:hypothetical protein